MAGEIIERDQNHETVGAGVDPNNTAAVVMLRVDPATDYLLVSLAGSSVGLGTLSSIAKRDQNHRTVIMGWNESTQQLQEIPVDDNGYILCTMA